MKPQDKAFEVQKNADGVVTAFRHATSSDTLLRVIFFTAAMDSNKGAILEKTNNDDVNVCVTSFKNYETHVRQLSHEQVSELLSGDPFFMSERFAEGESR